MRRLAAIAAATLALTPAAATAYDPPVETVLAVPATGAAVQTAFPTVSGTLYALTVTGTFAYNRSGSLADCGHHDTNNALVAQSWAPGGGIGLLVDGAPAYCSWYSDAHTYTVFVLGDGGPITLAIADATGHADNAGALTVAVTTESGVDGACEYHVTGSSLTGHVVTVVAEVHRTGLGVASAAWTGVYCALLINGAFQGAAYFVAEGPAAADSAVFTVPPGVIEVCLQAFGEDYFYGPVSRSWPCVS